MQEGGGQKVLQVENIVVVCHGISFKTLFDILKCVASNGVGKRMSSDRVKSNNLIALRKPKIISAVKFR